MNGYGGLQWREHVMHLMSSVKRTSRKELIHKIGTTAPTQKETADDPRGILKIVFSEAHMLTILGACCK